MKGLTLTAEEEIYKDFYVFYPTASQVPSNVTAYKAGTNYSFYYEGNFSSNMPEFNCDSLAVREEFKEIMKFYLDLGVDGFRLDAVKYYYFNNNAKNIEFLRWLNTTVKEIKSDAYIVGECFDGSSKCCKYCSGRFY